MCLTYLGNPIGELPNNSISRVRQVKIRNKWPDRQKIANKRFIADLC